MTRIKSGTNGKQEDRLSLPNENIFLTERTVNKLIGDEPR
jgi:hypothetical protein